MAQNGISATCLCTFPSASPRASAFHSQEETIFPFSVFVRRRRDWTGVTDEMRLNLTLFLSLS